MSTNMDSTECIESSAPERKLGVALPVAHLLALAPIDVWFGMLSGSRVHPRYWIRLIGIGFTSLVGTIWSLPERVLFWIGWTLFKKDPERFEHPAGVLVIVGYYRSGTTHAHNLIACSSSVITPRWYQALLGQGCWISWAITRVLLVPFLGSSRPQDGVGFGPMWPAEDDFALAGWGRCSPLPGRLIFPRSRARWDRWNDLGSCTADERRRWRRTLAGFAWKVTRRDPTKLLVLKTPNHGSHIAELVEVFGDHVRFLHVSRDPEKVLESNLRMHDALSAHLLQDPVDPTTLRADILDEYEQIERATIEQSQSLDEGRIAFVRHENLLADPCTQLESAFERLGLSFTESDRVAIERYLGELGPYVKPVQAAIDMGTPRADERERIERLQELRPSIDAVDAAPLSHTEPEHPRVVRGMVAAAIFMIVWGLLWIGAIWVIKQIDPEIKPRLDQLVWIGGSVIGIASIKASRRGSKQLGILAAALTLLVFVVLSFPITVLNWNFASDGTREQFLYHNTKGALHGLLAPSSLIFALLGMITAFRHAGSTGPRAPGLGG
ncbi:MAG: sulfotransferase [Phycisphaerales bacterium]|nr:sulfotransferase [Phycisphaerales bacterium]